MKYIPISFGIIIFLWWCASMVITYQRNIILPIEQRSWHGAWYHLFMAIYSITLGVIVILNTR